MAHELSRDRLRATWPLYYSVALVKSNRQPNSQEQTSNLEKGFIQSGPRASYSSTSSKYVLCPDNNRHQDYSPHRFFKDSPAEAEPSRWAQPSRLRLQAASATGSAAKRLSTTGIAIDEALDTLTPNFHPMPAQWGNRFLRAVRWQIGSCYRRLFSLVIIANAIAMIALISAQLPRGVAIAGVESTEVVVGNLQTAVAANLFAAVLVRNEHFVNLLYRVCVVHTSINAPFWLRRALAKVYCYGGAHSGCAVAACIWYLLLTIVQLSNSHSSSSKTLFTIAVSLAIWIILLVIIACSLPWIRTRFHNLFELTHRFGGWMTVLLVWFQLAAPSIDSVGEIRTRGLPDLVKAPALWFMLGITLLLAFPWLRLRKVPVRVQRLSRHAVRVFFNGRTLPCRVIRIADRPLTETHAFAVIGDSSGSNESSVLLSRAGDWTARIIDEPPLSFWVKGHDWWGMIRIATLFRKTVIVATGSGIGPCMSLFIGHPKLAVRVLWSTKIPETTYGHEVIQTVRRADPKARIIDTTIFGRFDMVQLSYDLYKESAAEAVVVISNPQLTERVVHGLECRGVAAYGPIWDS